MSNFALRHGRRDYKHIDVSLHLLGLSKFWMTWWRRLSSSLTILSQATIFRRSSWKLSAMLATRRPWIGIRMDHWALGKTQASQLFNKLQCQLIASIDANRQASTCEILYVVNTDTPHILETCIEISGIAAEGDPQL